MNKILFCDAPNFSIANVHIFFDCVGIALSPDIILIFAYCVSSTSLLEKVSDIIYNGSVKRDMGDVYMSATEVIKGILKDKNVTQVELVEKTNVTKQNLSNKMNRDNFFTLELVKIADALEMQLLRKNTSDGKEYIIDYSEEQKRKAKKKQEISRIGGMYYVSSGKRKSTRKHSIA